MYEWISLFCGGTYGAGNQDNICMLPMRLRLLLRLLCFFTEEIVWFFKVETQTVVPLWMMALLVL
jgi:hypothetical protein